MLQACGKRSGGAHEVGTANFLRRGGPGIWPVKTSVHEIGTANFVLGGATGQGRRGVAWGCSWHVASEEGGRRARNWYSEFRTWGWSWKRKTGARTKLAQRTAPSMWPQRRGGKAFTKLVQRLFVLQGAAGTWAKRWRRARSWHGELPARNWSWLLACGQRKRGKACTKLVQRISCLGARGWRARTKLAQRIWCFRVVFACGKKAGGSAHEIGTANFVRRGEVLLACGPSEEGGRRARNWYSEFCAWGWSWQGKREIGTAKFVLKGAHHMWEKAGGGVHEMSTANFVCGGACGKKGELLGDARNW